MDCVKPQVIETDFKKPIMRILFAIFDSQTMGTINPIALDGNPGGLSFDSGRVCVLSHTAPNITAINAAEGMVLGTVNLDAAVEEAKGDGNGHL